MKLLKKWRWDTGLEKLEEQRQRATPGSDRDLYGFFLGWMAGERGHYDQARRYLERVVKSPAVGRYALVGLAFVAYRERDLRTTRSLLDRARRRTKGADRALLATILHCEALVAIQEGQLEQAHEQLNQALEGFGPNHLGTGRVLDSLGSLYVRSNRLHAAERFYLESVKVKQALGDTVGLAVSYGQLGRIYLDWGKLDAAERQIRKDIAICEVVGDIRGLAQMHNLLGQVFLERQWYDKALAYLQESDKGCVQWKQSRLRAFVRKDLALVKVRIGDLKEAEELSSAAEQTFLAGNEAYGLAHVKRVQGVLARARGEFDRSDLLLRESAAYFAAHGLPAEAARSQLESAFTAIQRCAPSPLISDALGKALDQAERALRPVLIKKIGSLMLQHDEAEFRLREYRKVRGLGIDEATVFPAAKTEFASIMFLDIRDYTGFVQNEEADIVLSTLNQIFAEMVSVLEEHEVTANQYLGDGFMALARNSRHAYRAVAAGLELLTAFERINRPRRILNLPELQCRIGIATGPVVFGNVGTYRKLDFTAVGPTTNRAARLQTEARQGSVCICQTTYEAVRDSFSFQSSRPRTVDLKGFGRSKVWDAIQQPPG